MAELNAILDVMKFWPLHLGVPRPEPFSHQDWLFEIKYDGFRAIAQGEHVRCKLVPRNGNEFKFFLPLSESLGTDHMEATGKELFALACTRDLEVRVAKHNFGPYLQDLAQWFKIRNRKYSQWTGWEKFFAVT
jgi:ATP-dependent DNA ligase